jgi:hypothetical protein
MAGGRPKGSKHKPLIGAFSTDRRLTSLDSRTKAGRILRQTCRDLTAQLGGDPSPAETLLIQSAAIKAVRLYLLSEKLLADGAIGSDEHALAYLNSMRLDLVALGLKRRAKDVTPSLAEILASHSAEAAA